MPLLINTLRELVLAHVAGFRNYFSLEKNVSLMCHITCGLILSSLLIVSGPPYYHKAVSASYERCIVGVPVGWLEPSHALQRPLPTRTEVRWWERQEGVGRAKWGGNRGGGCPDQV